jgi:hypothetical protein
VEGDEDLSWVAWLKAGHMSVNVIYLAAKETGGQYLGALRVTSAECTCAFQLANSQLEQVRISTKF